MTQISNPGTKRRSEMEAQDKTRGRKSRVAKFEGIAKREGIAAEETSPIDEDAEGEEVDGHSSGTDGPSRKRRRSRKGLDKKFECKAEGCGKSYSRAEHL